MSSYFSKETILSVLVLADSEAILTEWLLQLIDTCGEPETAEGL